MNTQVKIHWLLGHELWDVDAQVSLKLMMDRYAGCCATEPGFAGDIGAIEIWLIDVLYDVLISAQVWLISAQVWLIWQVIHK